MRIERNPETAAKTLDRLVRGARGALPAEAFDGPTRARIVDAAFRGARVDEESAPLFVPIRRWIGAVLAPTMALAVLFVPMLRERTPARPDTVSAPRMTISKQGDEVVFDIANGGTVHRIYRAESVSELRSGLGDRPFAEVKGSFRDRLAPRDGEPALVFYRIE